MIDDIQEMIPIVKYTFVKGTREKITKEKIVQLRKLIGFKYPHFSRSYIDILCSNAGFKDNNISNIYNLLFPSVKFVLEKHNNIPSDITNIIIDYIDKNPQNTFCNNTDSFINTNFHICHICKKEFTEKGKLLKHNKTRAHIYKSNSDKVPNYLKSAKHIIYK